MLIYLAGPLFSAAETTFNERLTAMLEKEGFRVFLPQRDGVEKNKPPYDAMAPDARRRAMFGLDEAKIRESDVFLFVLDGRVPDEGACVELGMAHTHRSLTNAGRLLLGLHTDSRAAFPNSKLNPMLRVPPDKIAENERALLEMLKRYRTQRATSRQERP